MWLKIAINVYIHSSNSYLQLKPKSQWVVKNLFLSALITNDNKAKNNKDKLFFFSTEHKFKPLSQGIAQSARQIVDISQYDVVLEGEVLHVAVDGQEFPPGKDGKFNVEDAVLGGWVLHDEEETEVSGVPCPKDGLHHLLPALVEHSPTVRDDDEELTEG